MLKNKVIIYLFFVLRYKEIYGKASILKMLFYVILNTKKAQRIYENFFLKNTQMKDEIQNRVSFWISFRHNDHLAIFIKGNACFIGKLLRRNKWFEFSCSLSLCGHLGKTPSLDLIAMNSYHKGRTSDYNEKTVHPVFKYREILTFQAKLSLL